MSQDTPRPEQVMVRIPDMFVSFLAEPPRFNPNYSQVKARSEAWISKYALFPFIPMLSPTSHTQMGRFCSFDERMSMLISKCDFSYFIAIAAPEAGILEFRTLCDWGNWVFPFDDLFDNGELRDEPAAAATILRSLMSPMSKYQTWQEKNISRRERLPIVKVHDTGSSEGVQRRFSKAMADYCAGALIQVEDLSTHKIPIMPEEMLKRRQLSAGVSPLFSLVEYAHGLHIPDYVFEHPAIQEIERLGIDFVLLMNDTLSYMKEEGESVPHNIVAVARMSGRDAQEAFDYVGNMLESRYDRWEKAVDMIPHWGEDINKDVERYIRGVADVVRANLYWR
ncbi:isoprenoid synthase domain-containing protein [Xylaria sp. FL1777]|nr:isoprenoid synthase domain-containing protein [Xylaria sp. FL1777]